MLTARVLTLRGEGRGVICGGSFGGLVSRCPGFGRVSPQSEVGHKPWNRALPSLAGEHSCTALSDALRPSGHVQAQALVFQGWALLPLQFWGPIAGAPQDLSRGMRPHQAGQTGGLDSLPREVDGLSVSTCRVLDPRARPVTPQHAQAHGPLGDSLTGPRREGPRRGRKPRARGSC